MEIPGRHSRGTKQCYDYTIRKNPESFENFAIEKIFPVSTSFTRVSRSFLPVFMN